MAGFLHTNHPWRPRPAEYVRNHGWYQGGTHLRKVKPHYHWIWPKDGKRGSKWGRMKDLLSGEGPDIHLTISADKMDYMHNRQRRSRWANHTNLDDRGPDAALPAPCWTRQKRENLAYDFRPNSRKYRRPCRGMWTDAHWPETPFSSPYEYPRAFRDIEGEWFQWHPKAWEEWMPQQTPGGV